MTTEEVAKARHKDLEDLLHDAISALAWCGGSHDFGPEGKAKRGWEVVVQPILDRYQNLF